MKKAIRLQMVMMGCIVSLLSGCAEEEKATASIKVDQTQVVSGESLIFDAQDAIFDEIEWYQDDQKIPDCQNSDQCQITFYYDQLTATEETSSNGLQKQSSVKIKVKKAKASGDIPLLGDLMNPSQDSSDEGTLTLLVSPAEELSTTVATDETTNSSDSSSSSTTTTTTADTTTSSSTTTADTTVPSSQSVSINNGASSTTNTAVTLTLSAKDNVGVTGYYASESSTPTPSQSVAGWTAVTATANYSATVNFTLSSASGVGSYTRTVYVWFKDAAGNVSTSASATIQLVIAETTVPASPAIVLNKVGTGSGAYGTSFSTIALSLSATDNVGVTAWYASETATTPAATDGAWTSVTAATSYSGTGGFVLSAGNATKTVYA
ncbi:MAG: hypothetical protein HQM11_18325 [SAR324 cluster bacterium]|nr:hypothetical protein [SAR324 cluster bacterium]